MKIVQIISGRGMGSESAMLWALTNTGRIFQIDAKRINETEWEEIDVPYECTVYDDEVNTYAK